MSLNLYSDTEGTLFSSTSVTTKHNGFTGEADVFSFYLKNDNAQHSYASVIATVAIHPQLALDGWAATIYHGSENLSEEEWDEVGNSTNAMSLSDTNYHEYQVRVHCPASQQSEVYTDKISINVSAIESMS